jgi:DNA-binding transcriptional ArsR family regulator
MGLTVTEEELAGIAKALAHPARMRIVRLLARQKECMGGELFSDLPLAQSTVSQHLAVLKQAGIVVSHAVGPSSLYCLDPGVVSGFCAELSGIVADVPECSPDSEECR